MGVVGTGAGETKPGLHGLNLDVLQALFRKGTHHSGQCTNHNLEWVVLDPKQLLFSYKKLKHTPVSIFKLFFFFFSFPLHVRRRTITCHVVMGKNVQLTAVVGSDSRGFCWQVGSTQEIKPCLVLAHLWAAVYHPWLLCQRGATWHVVPLFGWCAELSSLDLMLNG